MRKPTRAIAIVAFAMLGCGGNADIPAQAGEWSGTVRDSAGILIVDNPKTGTWSDETRWTVHRDLAIGVREGEAEYQFGRIADIDAGPDGRMYVLDNQAAKVSVYDSAGHYVFSFGGPGRGPGEFSIGAFALLVDPSGTATVRDENNRRDNLFRADGAFLRSIPLSGPFREWEALPQGGHVTRSSRSTWEGIVRLGEGGQILDTVLTFEYDIAASRGALPSGPDQPPGSRKEIRLLPALPVWGVTTDGRVIAGVSDRYRIEVRRPDGAVEMVVERAHEPLATRSEDRARLTDRMKELMRAAGLTEDAIAGVFQRFAYLAPDSLPAFTGLIGGPEGTIWARGVLPIDSMPGNSTLDALYPGSSLWDVFSRDGRYWGQVSLPPRFTIERIRGDDIYGIEIDDLGVQRVVRLTIRR